MFKCLPDTAQVDGVKNHSCCTEIVHFLNERSQKKMTSVLYFTVYCTLLISLGRHFSSSSHNKATSISGFYSKLNRWLNRVKWIELNMKWMKPRIIWSTWVRWRKTKPCWCCFISAEDAIIEKCLSQDSLTINNKYLSEIGVPGVKHCGPEPGVKRYLEKQMQALISYYRHFYMAHSLKYIWIP